MAGNDADAVDVDVDDGAVVRPRDVDLLAAEVVRDAGDRGGGDGRLGLDGDAVGRAGALRGEREEAAPGADVEDVDVGVGVVPPARSGPSDGLS